MALVKCPTCGGGVSSSAVTCPHCGEPLKPVQQPQYQQVYQPQYQQPVQQPAPQPIQIAMPKMESMLMILLGIVSVILLAVERSHFGEADFSEKTQKAVFGFMMSFASLYFLIQVFKDESNQFLAAMAFSLAMFLQITQFTMWDLNPFNLEDHPNQKWLFEHYDYFSAAFGLTLMLYAGSVKNWSRIVMLTAGVLWIATVSWRPNHWMTLQSELLADHTLIILTIIMGASLVSMMVSWGMESSNPTQYPIIRLLAGVEALLILATIIIVAVNAKDIVDANYDKGMSPVRLATVFLMLSGAISLVFALLFAREDKMLYVTSAIAMAIAMFLILGYHFEFNVMTEHADSKAFRIHLQNQLRDLYYAARFMLPIAIMMYYVAEETKSITSNFSIKMQ